MSSTDTSNSELDFSAGRSSPRPLYPFSAIVNQELAKEALLLCVINPAVHGVLLLGPKGTGKTTLVRSLNTLMPQKQIIELPIGSGEDMVLGTVDAEKTLSTGEMSVKPGILARAHESILYIDEVNLLPDHLVDIILDAAATGQFRLEREGLSKIFSSRFILVGSMNPEEGWLRPQLLDRFGLAVHVGGLSSVQDRSEVIRRYQSFSLHPDAFMKKFYREQEQIRQALISARENVSQVDLTDEVLHRAVAMVLDLGVVTHRAELASLQGALARAAWHGRREVIWEDVQTVMPLALQHRLGEDSTHTPLTWESLERTIYEGRKESEKNQNRGWFPTPFFRKKKANRQKGPPG